MAKLFRRLGLDPASTLTWTLLAGIGIIYLTWATMTVIHLVATATEAMM